MQVISFIVVGLPIFYIILLIQKKTKLTKKSYLNVFILSIVGMFVSVVLNGLLTNQINLSFGSLLGAIIVGIVWGALVSLTLWVMKKVIS